MYVKFESIEKYTADFLILKVNHKQKFVLEICFDAYFWLG